ncbi:CCA tRNA nucleotidyltransferase [Brevibacterium sp. UCMA 11754]|uniref:CCA tRNA nucleotidyltransferase n=1 Tax=Brevibacterium sp. UCMA 11754 TaxID=2749198 RepID=UPI001F27592E|nr:CCA tRNA nucleotidyltransferase [Brevibacterium sp. UCMA 11754]MCF2572480.1 CCA tRNA nucleotidyltransferase [Brevibacterium sp. UCMA 11754]
MDPKTAHARLYDKLDELENILGPLGKRFAAAGFELALVGGSVRDALLGRPMPDLDFTTDARPDDILSLISDWVDTHWDIGREFGTIGAIKSGVQIEITTYRAEAYDPDSRKPTVKFGTDLDADLVRRDFTIGAMAIRLPAMTFVDPFEGFTDLVEGVIRTPGTAADSFSDDPLRMMRAARFTAQLGLDPVAEVESAMRDMADRIAIISAERIQVELFKLMTGIDPAAGIDLLVRTDVADHVLPEVAGLRLETDEHHRHKDVYQHSLTVLRQAVELEEQYAAKQREAGLSSGDPNHLVVPDFTVRFAALMHDVGKPATRRFLPGGAVTFYHHDAVGAKLTAKRMKALRFDKDTTKAVGRLVELHLRFYGYGDAGWTDSAVRRYVTDAGPLLSRLHILTRADVTTRNKKKADRLAFAYDDLEHRIEKLSEQEELAAIRPDLDGRQIMAILDIEPSPLVGKAYKHLLEERMEHGPLGPERAEEVLRQWWAENGPAEVEPGEAGPRDVEPGEQS